MAQTNLDCLDVFDLSVDDVLKMLPSRIITRGMGYSERVCLERWVSGLEPVFVYGRNGMLRGISAPGGPIAVHAPPTDKWYLDSQTGYPPDWNFYAGVRGPSTAASTRSTDAPEAGEPPNNFPGEK